MGGGRRLDRNQTPIVDWTSAVIAGLFQRLDQIGRASCRERV